MTESTTAPLLARDLLRAALVALRSTATFVVLRNYENLPDEWSNDIDIMVTPQDLEPAFSVLVATLQAQAGSAPIEVLRRINYRAVRVSCADRTLQVDLLSGLSKCWVTYADATAILAARRPWSPLFEVPAPLHEMLVIAAKELLAYGEIRPRYHDRLGGQDLQTATIEAARLFGVQMTQAGQALVSRALADPTVRGRPAPRIGALMQLGAACRWIWMRCNSWAALVDVNRHPAR